MDRRTVIATVLILAVWMAYAEYMRRTAPPPPPPTFPTETAPVETAPPPPPSLEPPPVQAPPSMALPPPEEARPAQTYVIENELYRAVFTDLGARLQSFTLKRYQQALDHDSPPVQLVRVGPEGKGWPLGLRLRADTTLDLNGLHFDGRREPNALFFSATLPDGVEITKVFAFEPDSYLFSLEVRVRNANDRGRNLGVSVLWREAIDPNEEQGRYAGHVGPVTLLGTEVEREELEDLEGSKLLEGEILWTGYETKYFLAAMIPDQPDRARVQLSKQGPEAAVTDLFFPPIAVPAGASISQTIQVFAGPKSIEELRKAGVGLEEAVAFGFFAVLAKPLLLTLNFFQRIVGNYGVAIILLTILIRIFFFPLATKQFRSMKEMQRLQPLLKELKEKYKDEKEKLNQETMQLFRTHKVNPLGGCLPILVQIPVFIALYQALLNSIALRQAPFIFWLKDLSAPDPTYITPVLMTGSMFLQQKMSPPAADPAQQKIMMFMPLIFGVMFLNFPSGLVLYWLINNLLAIGQQYWINRRYG